MPRVRERGGYRGGEAPTGRLRPLPGAPPSAAAAARRSSTFPAGRAAPPSHPLLADTSGPAPRPPGAGAASPQRRPRTQGRGRRKPIVPAAHAPLPRRCGHIPRPRQAGTLHGLTCCRDPRARAASQPPPPPPRPAPAEGSSRRVGAPPRPAARGCPLPSSEERRLHNFVRERPAPAAPPPPPPACPFVGEARGRPAAGGALGETRSRAGARGGSLRPPAPGPAAAGPATLLRGQRPLPAPVRPARAGLRERGAPGHLTARPPLPRRLGGRSAGGGARPGAAPRACGAPGPQGRRAQTPAPGCRLPENVRHAPPPPRAQPGPRFGSPPEVNLRVPPRSPRRRLLTLRLCRS
ncbi:unnamed protein product [Nyctereutes procyonoides]|uniref:(raccoon dog) hypothetical protein n=1 Tax=Nyctereutes procyonoides TaxID=34880 RepID=A0A811ZSB0_NYCPR|nr:unnamed protein product [Nyctereutes procyonoides]